MATLTTKYSVGDRVYYASTSQTRKQHPCPDCMGTRKWKGISPAGSEFEFTCPRCSTSYRSDHEMSLEYTANVGTARLLTIGSIRIDTKPSWGSSDTVQYMCVETGVGGGSIYNENRLFETEAEALACADEMAREQDKGEWVSTLYNKTLEISDYQLESAKLKAAQDAMTDAKSKLWNLGYLFDQIEEAEGKDDILEHVQHYREYDWQRDKDKIANATPL